MIFLLFFEQKHGNINIFLTDDEEIRLFYIFAKITTLVYRIHNHGKRKNGLYLYKLWIRFS